MHTKTYRPGHSPAPLRFCQQTAPCGLRDALPWRRVVGPVRGNPAFAGRTDEEKQRFLIDFEEAQERTHRLLNESVAQAELELRELADGLDAWLTEYLPVQYELRV